MSAPTLLDQLRRSLLIKVISRHAPSRADVAAVIELTAAKVVEALQAQSIAFYLSEGDKISVRQIYHSPTLWEGDPAKEQVLRDTAKRLLAQPPVRDRGIVGQVIASGEPVFFRNTQSVAPFLASLGESAGFEVHSTLTVPLTSAVVIGAIQVFNKETSAGTDGDFTQNDLGLLQEVAEYSATLIRRMVDPNFQPHAEDAARFIARLTDLPLISRLEDIAVDGTLLSDVGEATIRRDGVFPYRRLPGNAVAVVMTNPLDHARREMFSREIEMAIEEVSVVSATLFEALIHQQFKNAEPAAPEIDRINVGAVVDIINSTYSDESTFKTTARELEREDSAPIIQLTNRIIEDAHASGASDIHIEPTEKSVVVRYRIDGLCQDKLTLPKEAAGAIVARLKIMSNLDISEKRLPQDGRIIFKKYSKKNIEVDLRVAVGPVSHGEKVVMRLLDKSKSALPLGALGFSDENLAAYRDCIRQPHGMILHCGPTGSGKSMTLYSALAEVNTRDTNIQTAEDPIEYTLPGLNQTQMNRQIGLTFARALRSYLRMDPDIILIGEIRDSETAQISVEAALTGHMLVSTLHTNDAPSSVTRLAEMGVEPFNISASLVCVCAQRLLRRVCRSCRVPHEPAGREAELMQRAIGWSGPVFRARKHGCAACSGLGFKGRVGIHELMVNNEELTEAINSGATVADLKRIAMQTGMKTLHQDAMLKVREGTTTVEEALATVPPDSHLVSSSAERLLRAG